MNDVLGGVADWHARGERLAVATVVAVQRSAPRPLGTKMIVSDSGAVAGGVSGGCVEGAVVEQAEAVLRGEPSRLMRYGFSDADAWDVGLPCGGEIEVWIEPWNHDRLVTLSRAGARAARVTVLAGERRGAHLILHADGSAEGTLGTAALDAAAAGAGIELMWEERSARRELLGEPVFVDVVCPPPRLLIVGAIDLAAALCATARAAGFVPFVIDPRGRFATQERFPQAEEVLRAWPEEAFARLGGLDAATAVCALTHDPKLDDAALLAALDSDAGYIGAMGSRHAQSSRRVRLIEAGVTEEQLQRIAAPIGLDLGAVSTAETAVSIVAEIIALRHRRAGGRLAHGHGPIHARAGA